MYRKVGTIFNFIKIRIVVKVVKYPIRYELSAKLLSGKMESHKKEG